MTYYLDPEANPGPGPVAATLDAVATLAPGSRVAFDSFSWSWVKGSDAPLVIRMRRPMLTITGEEGAFGINTPPDARDYAASFTEAHGLDLTEWAPYGDPAEPFGGPALATVGVPSA